MTLIKYRPKPLGDFFLHAMWMGVSLFAWFVSGFIFAIGFFDGVDAITGS